MDSLLKQTKTLLVWGMVLGAVLIGNFSKAQEGFSSPGLPGPIYELPYSPLPSPRLDPLIPAPDDYYGAPTPRIDPSPIPRYESDEYGRLFPRENGSTRYELPRDPRGPIYYLPVEPIAPVPGPYWQPYPTPRIIVLPPRRAHRYRVRLW